MTDKKNILLQPRHLVREKEPRMEDFKLNSSFSNMPMKVYDETAYQKAMEEFKERNPEKPDYVDCDVCNGTGSVARQTIRVEPECCCQFDKHGGCCNNPNPSPTPDWEPEQCVKCYATGNSNHAKVKAYEESRIFYEGFEGEDGCYHNNVVMAVFGTGGGFEIEFINTPDKHYLENGISLYLWEAITGLKPKEI